MPLRASLLKGIYKEVEIDINMGGASFQSFAAESKAALSRGTEQPEPNPESSAEEYGRLRTFCIYT